MFSEISSKRVLVMCLADPSHNPRPKRAAELCLSLGLRVSVMGRPLSQPFSVQSYYSLPALPADVFSKILRRLWCVAGNLIPYEKWRILCEKKRFALTDAEKSLGGQRFDLLIVENLQLLPIAFAIKGNAKILFDAREYYPREYEGGLWFELFEKRRRVQLCREYMTRCDAVVTVSEGLRREYKKEFNIDATVYRSTPPYADFPAKPTNPDNIRMIYHGAANPDRRLENLIDVVAMLDDRFTLDLILVGNPRYQQKLKCKAASISRVSFPPPVPFEQIIPTLSEYDVGFFYCEPTTFNLENSLPNKFFEYIQARLALAIGPSPDMAELVRQYDCGIVAEKFTVESMAEALNRLSAVDIDKYKQGSDLAAHQLCFEKETEKLVEIVSRFLT